MNPTKEKSLNERKMDLLRRAREIQYKMYPELQLVDPLRPDLTTRDSSPVGLRIRDLKRAGDRQSQRAYKYRDGLLLEVTDTVFDKGGTVSTLLPITPDLQREFSEWLAANEPPKPPEPPEDPFTFSGLKFSSYGKIRPGDVVFYSSPFDPSIFNSPTVPLEMDDKQRLMLEQMVENQRRKQPVTISRDLLDDILQRLRSLEREVAKMRFQGPPSMTLKPAKPDNLPNRGINLE